MAVDVALVAGSSVYSAIAAMVVLLHDMIIGVREVLKGRLSVQG